MTSLPSRCRASRCLPDIRPLILESMSAIDGSGLKKYPNLFWASFYSAEETVTRTPGFMLVNMLRDSFSAFVTSGASFLPFFLAQQKDFFSNISNLGKNRSGWWLRLWLWQTYEIGKIFAQEADRRNRNGLPLNMFKTIWDASGRLTTRSDAATRQAVYDEVYARTGNEAEAHFQAMEVLNFSRRGSNGLVRAITAAIPFLNARYRVWTFCGDLPRREQREAWCSTWNSGPVLCDAWRYYQLCYHACTG